MINTDGLKSLFQWVKQKTDTTDDRYKNIIKRLFILRQFFSLWLLNKIYEVFENVVNHDPYFRFHFNVARELDRDLAQELNLDRDHARDRDLVRELNSDRFLVRDLVRGIAPYLDQDRDLDLEIAQELNLAFNHAPYLDQDRDLDLEIALVRDLAFNLAFDLHLCLYQDFYKTMDTDFFQSVSSQSRNRFDEQLQNQIAWVNGLKKIKIFKQVDLQRMVQRFNEQREIIKAAAERKSVEPSAESIHDTWLSVLDITDEMLAIPRETLETYVTYLEAVELIVACKEAAGRVSPKVCQEIEDRFFDCGCSRY